MKFKTILFTICTLSVVGAWAGSANAADLGVPFLEPSFELKERFTGDNVMKTGIRLEQTPDLAFEPEVGVSLGTRNREVRSGYDDITRRVHAQAGGKVDLFNVVSLSAAAKLPLYTASSSERMIAGGTLTQPGDTRHGYDFLHRADKLSWTGEVGLRLGPADLNLYYGRSRFDDFSGSGTSGFSRYEDTFGTRLIFRFK